MQHAPHATESMGPIEAVNRRFMRLLGEEGGPLPKIWGVLTLVNLAIVLVTAVSQMKSGAPMLHQIFDPEVVGTYQRSQPGFSFFGLLTYPLLLIFVGLYHSSMNAMREVDLRGTDVTFSEAKALSLERLGPTLAASLLAGMATGFGLFFCVIPGIVAFFLFYLAPYLVAAEGLSPLKAMAASSTITRRHALLVCLLLAVTTVLTVGSFVVQIATMTIFASTMGKTGILVGHLAAWGFVSLVGYFSWLYAGSIFVTIGNAERDGL